MKQNKYDLISLTNDLDELEKILRDSTVDVNSVNDLNNTALFHAGYEKSKLLIKYGADVNHVNDSGKNPLFISYNMSKEKLKLLLKNGANVNLLNSNNNYINLMTNPPIRLGSKEELSSYIDLLKEYNFDFKSINNLLAIENIELLKLIFNKRYITVEDIPNYIFEDNEENQKYYTHYYENKDNLFINRITSKPEIVEFFLDIKPEIFNFLINKYEDFSLLKKDLKRRSFFPEKIELILDKSMIYYQIEEEKKHLLSSIKIEDKVRNKRL